MHSTSVRVQNVFGFFTTVAFVVAFLTALTAVLYPATPTATVDVVSVRVVKGRPQYYSSKQQEYSLINFDLEANLDSLYNWNTKQVFCWLSVVYGGAKGSKHTENEVIIWDAILPSKRTSRLHLRNEKAKYQINDISGRFLERNATVRFGWNVQPHVGALIWGTVEADNVVEGVDLEAAKGKRGEGWSFTFPPVGGRKKTPVVENTKAKVAA
ncbi:signal peptidase subunit-domain-containing protein [Pyronema omphalodes]|nr:signal peptidase subunit-domain-containing protein [Pyronema omphalodes]